MLQSLREEKKGKLQVLLSLRKNGLTSLFKEVRVFKVGVLLRIDSPESIHANRPDSPLRIAGPGGVAPQRAMQGPQVRRTKSTRQFALSYEFLTKDAPKLPEHSNYSAGTQRGYGLVAYGMAIFQSPKIFFRERNFQENPGISAERTIFAKFQAPKFENSEPEKMQFHTPSHSIPTLDSLLIIVGVLWPCYRGELPRPLKVQNGVANKSKSPIFQLFWLFFDSVLDFLGPRGREPGAHCVCRSQPLSVLLLALAGLWSLRTSL